MFMCWVSLCWMSLGWMSLCWMSLGLMSLCWMSLWWISFCWMSLCRVSFMLSVTNKPLMLTVTQLNVIMLSVVVVKVMAPRPHIFYNIFCWSNLKGVWFVWIQFFASSSFNSDRFNEENVYARTSTLKTFTVVMNSLSHKGSVFFTVSHIYLSRIFVFIGLKWSP
jgi:hypothetical protein